MGQTPSTKTYSTHIVTCLRMLGLIWFEISLEKEDEVKQNLDMNSKADS